MSDERHQQKPVPLVSLVSSKHSGGSFGPGMGGGLCYHKKPGRDLIYGLLVCMLLAVLSWWVAKSVKLSHLGSELSVLSWSMEVLFFPPFCTSNIISLVIHIRRNSSD